MNLRALFRIGALVLLLGLAGLAGCTSRKVASEAPPLTVSVAQLVQGKALDYEDFTGRTGAIEAVDVKARVTGYLDKVLFKDGEMVKKDQVLYEIDPRTYQAKVDNARGALANTEAALQNYAADLSRARRMRVGDAIGREEYDKIQANKQQADAQLISNRAALKDALLYLSFCTVKSPITGRASRTKITAGNLVTADQTSLTSVVTLDPIYGYFDVDEHTMLRIQRMIREEISVGGIDKAKAYLRERKLDEAALNKAVGLIRDRLNEANRTRLRELLDGKLDGEGQRGLYAILEANPKFPSYREATVPVYLGTRLDRGYPHAGRIDFADNRLDPTTGTLRVRGIFPNKHGILTPDLSVRIRVPIGDPHPAILVSEAALVTDQDRKFLFVVNDKDEVEQRPVVLGPLYDGMRVLEGGVRVGDWVVVSNLQRVRPGMTVKRQEVPMPRPLGQQDLAPPPPPAIRKK